MKRLLSNLAAILSLLLCIGVCVLWVRGRGGSDQAAWTYDRWLPDGGAASTQITLSSEKRLWLGIYWGQVGPPNGQLVWGYYLNADQSGGHPRLRFSRAPYHPWEISGLIDPDRGASGWGPLRWSTSSRSRPKDGDDSRSITLGISHWLAALLLAIGPTLRFKTLRRQRRIRRVGLCPKCGYDLRATPDPAGPRLAVCPECGRGG